MGPLAIARAFASFVSFTAGCSPLGCSTGFASLRSVRKAAAGTSPVDSTSFAISWARSWRTARNSSTRSFTSGRP